MTAREILQALKSKIDQSNQLNEEEIQMTVQGSKNAADAVILVPVEGSTRILKVTVQELGTYEGLAYS